MPRPSRRAAVASLILLLAACSSPSSTDPTASAGASAPTFAPSAGASSDPADFHVAPEGDDDADGSAAHPWRTLQHAAEAGSGTIAVAAGSYAGFRLTRSGTPADPIRFIGAGADVASIGPGAALPDVISLSGVANVEISGFTISGATAKLAAGVRVRGASIGLLINGNRIIDNTSFGIEIEQGRAIAISGNEIARNEAGIRLIDAIGGVIGDVEIKGNEIHDNDRLVVDDPTPGNDFGANGIILHETTGDVRIAGNRLYGNRGTSTDYGTDGGAFEIWAASNIEITENELFDNENVLETGTYGPECTNLTFMRNVAYRPADAPRAVGLILRCASSSLVAHNTLVGLDWFAFDISHDRGQFGGSVDGLEVLDNIVADGRAYLLDSPLPASVVLDHNLIDPSVRLSSVAPTLASIDGYGPVVDLSTFSELTGQELHGLADRPDFVDADAHDYRLADGSPGIDAGIPVGGEAFSGAAPDIGRYEYAG